MRCISASDLRSPANTLSYAIPAALKRGVTRPWSPEQGMRYAMCWRSPQSFSPTVGSDCAINRSNQVKPINSPSAEDLGSPISRLTNLEIAHIHEQLRCPSRAALLCAIEQTHQPQSCDAIPGEEYAGQ